jgi:hypothetical protein
MPSELFIQNSPQRNSVDSSVGTTTGFEMDGQDSILVRGKKLFSSPERSDRLMGHPASYPMGIGGCFTAGA